MKLFETAEIAKLDPQEFKAYQASLNAYRDIKNSIDTAREEVIIDVVKKALKAGLDIATVMQITGLSKEEVEALEKETSVER